MDRATALRRLRACAKLAKSSNPNEAATAVRHMQALMREHGFSLRDSDDDAIHEVEGKTSSRGYNPPVHIWNLAVACGHAFNCYVYAVLEDTRTVVKFVGRQSAPELSSYAFTVLRRQLEAAVKQHTRRCTRRYTAAAKAQQYGLGWVGAVRITLGVRDLTDEREAECKAFLADAGKRIESKAAVPLKDRNLRDRMKGFSDGREVKLNPGVEGATTKQLEHHQ